MLSKKKVKPKIKEYCGRKISYSRVHISLDSLFSKILKKPSIVQKKWYLIWTGCLFSLRWSKKKSKWPTQKNSFSFMILKSKKEHYFSIELRHFWFKHNTQNSSSTDTLVYIAFILQDKYRGPKVVVKKWPLHCMPWER